MPLLRSTRRGLSARICLTSLALVTTALVGGAAAHADNGAASITDPECISAPAERRVRTDSGKAGVDPNTLSEQESSSAESQSDTRIRARKLTKQSAASLGRTTIDVYVHVITKTDGTGRVPVGQVTRQISVLNQAYAGRTGSDTAATPFRFQLAGIDYTRNDDWYDWSIMTPDDDKNAKRALHKGGFDDLNLYVTGLGDGLLGYATFPWQNQVKRDGVVLLNDSLPGGSAAPFNEGDTATHEVGHWLGLYHTFQGGCSQRNDGVSDTPAQADGDNIFSCDAALDTCPKRPGLDPVHNFMSYGDDACLDRFTAGQAALMRRSWAAYRLPSTP